jgi:hypothetical protein
LLEKRLSKATYAAATRFLPAIVRFLAACVLA